MLGYDVVATSYRLARQFGALQTCGSAARHRCEWTRDAFNSADFFLTAIAACMIKGIERIAPMNKFEYRSVEVRLHEQTDWGSHGCVAIERQLNAKASHVAGLFCHCRGSNSARRNR